MKERGQILGNFKLATLLGTGSSGEVWAAVGPDKKIHALKVFHPNKVEEARKEYSVSAAFQHPGLLHPVSFVSNEETPFIVLPYCEGRSADNLAGFLQEEGAWQLLADIAEALVYLHDMGYCHGDIKPSNILWDGTRFLLADFGACEKPPKETSSQDPSSYQFAAPEKASSGAADIWSLGATLFHLVLGTNVFNGLGGAAQQLGSPLPYLRKSMPQLSELVRRCLTFSPRERPSAQELYAAAKAGLELCRKRSPARALKAKAAPALSDAYAGFWPDEMKEPV